MDTYSNLLFVKELKTEMAELAHKAVGINKYRPETCCVIGENLVAIGRIENYTRIFHKRCVCLKVAHITVLIFIYN